jgi:hypothetical protein
VNVYEAEFWQNVPFGGGWYATKYVAAETMDEALKKVTEWLASRKGSGPLRSLKLLGVAIA